MKSLHLYLKNIAMISFVMLVVNCTSQKIELENAQSQNIEFLIEQATNLWDNRSDTNAIKQANYFLGLAYNVKKHKYGNFVLLNTEFKDANFVNEFKVFLNLNKEVMKYMIIKLDEKPSKEVQQEVSTEEEGNAQEEN